MKRTLRKLCLCGLFAAVLAAASNVALAQNSFTVTHLGWLPGDDGFKLSRGLSLNSAGQVVGGSSGRQVVLSSGARIGGFVFGFQWDAANGMQYVFDSVYPNSTFTSQAYGINDTGSLIGFFNALEDPTSGYFRFQSGIATPLQPPSVGASLFPRKINNLNQIVGQSFTSNPSLTSPILWDVNGMPTVLSVPGTGASAYGINDATQVVGESNVNSSAPSLPFLWDSLHGGQTLPFLGVGGGARAISGNGKVAGYVELQLGHTQDHAALWSGNTLTDIHRFGTNSLAVDINDAGQAVGAFGNDYRLYFDAFSPYAGFYYDGAVTHNLIAMTDESLPYTHLLPYAINAQGQIAAEGFVAVENFPGSFGLHSVEAVLLTPSNVVLPVPQDVTNGLSITISPKPTYNPVTKLWERVLTLQNRSGVPLAGPFRAPVNTPGATFLVSPQTSGKTQVVEPLGQSFYQFDVSGGSLAPGASLNAVFSFSLPGLKLGTNLTVPQVFSGPGRL